MFARLIDDGLCRQGWLTPIPWELHMVEAIVAPVASGVHRMFCAVHSVSRMHGGGRHPPCVSPESFSRMSSLKTKDGG